MIHIHTPSGSLYQTVTTPMSQERVPALATRDLYKEFWIKKQRHIVVDQLSLTVEQGEIFGLLGPNGSGKTTTMNIISGLIRQTSGDSLVFGLDVHRQAHIVRQLLGVVPQETALYEELTAWQNMDFHADLFRIPRNEKRTRIDRMLQLVQLEDRKNSRVRTFSGGMKRRLAIGRALLHDPHLLYLDEPTLGVDVQSKEAIWTYIRSLKMQGKTILITTNYLEEAEALCDRLAIIDHGTLIAVDTIDHLKAVYGSTLLELQTAQPCPIGEKIRALPGVRDIQMNENHLFVKIQGSDANVAHVISLVASECCLLDVHRRQSQLNDIFLQLTGTTQRNEKTLGFSPIRKPLGLSIPWQK